MEAKEIIRKMREDDRLLKESKVMKSVQKAIIELGYEPFGVKQEKIYEAIEKTPTASAWIPCSERLPKEDTEVLGYGQEGYTYIVKLYDTKIYGKVWKQWNGGDMRLSWIIAWMPLPQPYVKGE